MEKISVENMRTWKTWKHFLIKERQMKYKHSSSVHMFDEDLCP